MFFRGARRQAAGVKSAMSLLPTPKPEILPVLQIVTEGDAAVPSQGALAAEPPLEPPGARDRSHGLRTGPNAEFSFEPPIANSSMLVLPTNTASAFRSRATTSAS